MKRKDYQKPATRVAKLQLHCHLMQGSPYQEPRRYNGGSLPQGIEGEDF